MRSARARANSLETGQRQMALVFYNCAENVDQIFLTKNLFCYGKSSLDYLNTYIN